MNKTMNINIRMDALVLRKLMNKQMNIYIIIVNVRWLVMIIKNLAQNV